MIMNHPGETIDLPRRAAVLVGPRHRLALKSAMATARGVTLLNLAKIDFRPRKAHNVLGECYYLRSSNPVANRTRIARC